MSLLYQNSATQEFFFDETLSSKKGNEPNFSIPRKVDIKLIFIIPSKWMMQYSYNLSKSYKNNKAEYEALMTSLELANLEVKILLYFNQWCVVFTII